MKSIGKFFQHNWPAIIYWNFKLLPFRQAVKLPIDIYNRIQIDLDGKIVLNGTHYYRGAIKIGSQGSDMFPKNPSIFKIKGTLVFNGTAVIGCGNSISVGSNAILEIGEHSILGANNLILCDEHITLGKDFLSSWNCQIMDTDTHPLIDGYSKKESKYKKTIVIGNHTWIGNNVFINKGTILPSNSIIASHSLCNKDYSCEGENCVFAGIPAKVVKTNKFWKI